MSLKVVHQNIRSIHRNLPGLLTLLQRSNTDWDIIVVTECWLRHTDYILSIDGYSYIQSANNLTQNEGVVVYFKQSMRLTVIQPTLQDVNCIMIKVDNNVTVISIYRPPGYKNLLPFYYFRRY